MKILENNKIEIKTTKYGFKYTFSGKLSKKSLQKELLGIIPKKYHCGKILYKK